MAKSRRADGVREQTATLVRSFLASATSEFSPLVAASDASWSVRVEHIGRSGIVPVAPEDIAGFFFVTGTFATPQISGAITYGDRELGIDTVLGPRSGSARYGLWEWADALGRSDLVQRDTDFVLTTDRIETIVSGMARATLSLRDDIAAAAAPVVEQMERARRMRHEEFQNKLAQDDYRRARASADKAFAAGDFNLVVSLLAPFDALLTPADRRKLLFASKHSGS